MREFILPELQITELSPANSVMDDITASKEFPGLDNEEVVPDPGKDDEVIW